MTSLLLLTVPSTATPRLGSIHGHCGFGDVPLGKQTTGNVGHATVGVGVFVVGGNVGDVSVTPGGSVMIGNGISGRLYGQSIPLLFTKCDKNGQKYNLKQISPKNTIMQLHRLTLNRKLTRTKCKCGDYV